MIIRVGDLLGGNPVLQNPCQDGSPKISDVLTGLVRQLDDCLSPSILLVMWIKIL